MADRTAIQQQEKLMAEDEEKGMVKRKSAESGVQEAPYQAIFGDVSHIIDEARKTVARSVNATLTAACWMIGRRIVEIKQSGEERAEPGPALIRRLARISDKEFWTRLLTSEPPEHAPVLSVVPTRPNSLDTV